MTVYSYSCEGLLALLGVSVLLTLIFTLLAYLYGKQKGYEMYREDLRELKKELLK